MTNPEVILVILLSCLKKFDVIMLYMLFYFSVEQKIPLIAIITKNRLITNFPFKNFPFKNCPLTTHSIHCHKPKFEANKLKSCLKKKDFARI